MQWRGEVPPPERVARLGLLIALAAALQATEGLLPSPAPWFRLGLGNAFVLATLCAWGSRDALWVGLGKVLLGSLLGGRFLSPAFLLSLGGTLSAVSAMAAAARLIPPLGVTGLSLVGAQAHTLAQIGLAGLLLRTPALWSLAPVLSALAVAAGIATGLAAHAVMRALRESDELAPGAGGSEHTGGRSQPPATGGNTLRRSPSRSS